MTATRRTFVGTLAAGIAGFSRGALAADPQKDLALGVIGVGWYGMVDARAALKAGGAKIAAICDVDSEHLDGSAAELHKLQGERPKTFKQYTDLLAMEGLDAVIIGTPPQWHALQLIDAVGQSLDVYCEKPLAYDVREGRAMIDAVRKSGRVVQIGFQRRQSDAFRQVKQHIASGAAGKIVQVDVQIHYTPNLKPRVTQDPPATLDWDQWCGPAPKLPYSPEVGHKKWRLEESTGNGHLVDWGIHNIDAVRKILDLSMPQRIAATGGNYQSQGKITTPDVLNVQFDFDDLPVMWRHRIWGAASYAPETDNGIFFYGEKETIFATDRSWTIIPRGKSGERMEFKAPSDLGGKHMAEFLAAVRQEGAASCDIEDAYRSTATVQLAMIALKSGRPIEWDEASDQIVNNPQAAKLLRREYRSPWVHPFSPRPS
ncbi:MAG: Gfo/Idh/MocA family oxidoreductase [Planctomycetota bacterium]